MIDNIKQKHKEGGFTIIEVMIVLAIAGLIMVVVFLAVPALQRSSRNNQRKTDATNVASLVSEYSGNQNGVLPPAATGSISGTTATLGSGNSAVTTNVSGQISTGSVVAWTATIGATPAVANTALVVYTGATCSGNTLVAGSTRQAAVWYSVEPGTVFQCVAV